MTVKQKNKSELTTKNIGRGKRVVLISDLHCGHRFGLTPPDWQLHEDREGYYAKIAKFSKELWAFYTGVIDNLKPVDILICNGDSIDGKGQRSGGTELIVSDRNEQILIAKKCIDYAEAKKVIVVNGTPYHTGTDDDFEAMLSELLHAEYGNHCHLDISGVKLDIKHKVSSSVIPHGRYTSPRREAVWNAIWAERGLMEHADFIIRSHVHYYSLSEDAATTVITTPALQGWTKYGSRECSGVCDIGLLSFDCLNGNASMTKHFFDMRKFKVEFKKI
jgi:hypothetical protein